MSRKKRLKTKYILRRVAFIFLLLLLLALGAFGLWRLFGGEGEKAPPPSQPTEGTSQPAPDATAQTGGEPEPSAPAESQQGEDQNAAVKLVSLDLIELHLQLLFDGVGGVDEHQPPVVGVDRGV